MSTEAIKLIAELVIASQELSWMGSQPPDDHDAIKDRYVKALNEVTAFIAKLEINQK